MSPYYWWKKAGGSVEETGVTALYEFENCLCLPSAGRDRREHGNLTSDFQAPNRGR